MSKKEEPLKLDLGWGAAMDIFAAFAMLLYVFFLPHVFEVWATVAWQCFTWYGITRNAILSRPSHKAPNLLANRSTYIARMLPRAQGHVEQS